MPQQKIQAKHSEWKRPLNIEKNKYEKLSKDITNCLISIRKLLKEFQTQNQSCIG